MDEWIVKILYIHIMNFYLPIKKNEIIKHLWKWTRTVINIESDSVSERQGSYVLSYMHVLVSDIYICVHVSEHGKIPENRKGSWKRGKAYFKGKVIRKIKGNIWCKIQRGLNVLSRALGGQEWRKKGREGQ